MTKPTNYGSPIKGTITTGTTDVITLTNVQYPASIALNSTSGGRAIAISFGEGTGFYTITPTLTASDQIVSVLTYPVTKIRVTGTSGDTYTII